MQSDLVAVFDEEFAVAFIGSDVADVELGLPDAPSGAVLRSTSGS